MNIRLLAASVIVVGLTACQTTTTNPASTTASVPSPSTAKTVVGPLIGKRLVGDNVTFIINADGTMGGTFRGEPVVGTYQANAKESCSSYSSPKSLTGREFCSTPVISGNTVVFNRRDGSKSPVYTIKN